MDYKNIVSITNRHICMDNFLASKNCNGKSGFYWDSIYDISEPNRLHCSLLLRQIYKLSQSNIEFIILREKDLPKEDYSILAENALRICSKTDTRLILHTFIETAEKLNYKHIHLPLCRLQESSSQLADFETIGVSIHSLEEALLAKSLGASYITAGHVFATDCKKGLPGRGLSFLQQICSALDIPVYAIGGINSDNIDSVLNAGAAGGCMMSGTMK